MATNDSALCSAFPDNSFGPQVEACARAFDFTLLFEESVLSVIPSAILLLLAPYRLVLLSRKRQIIGGNGLRIAKMVAIVAFGAIQTALLALWVMQSSLKTRASTAAAILYLLNFLVFMALSFTEHARSISPSGLLNFYLVLTVLFDTVRTRTLWLLARDTPIPILFSLSLTLKIVILALEEVNKSKYIYPGEGVCAAEETAGIFSRTLFVWLNDMIRRGFTNVLTVEELPAIDRRMCSESLWTSVGANWDRAHKQGKYALLLTVFKTLKWALLAPVPPFVCLVALTVTQPILINTFLNFLNTPSDGTIEQRNTGYGLIGAYALVYIGIGISTAWAQQATYRFVTMVRGCLVTLIYRKTTTVEAAGLDDAAAVTLMSTDVERIIQGLAFMNEVWTTLLQITVSLYLLYGMVGVAFIVPLLMFLVCGIVVGTLASQAGARQALWMSAIEKRVGATAAMLGAMKGVKLSGLSRKLSIIITSLRLAEISSAHLYRSMLTYIVTLSYTPNSISPIITFGAYIVIAAKSGTVLDSTRIFTSLSLLALITEPLKLLFHAIPEFFAAVACFARIQEFLVAVPRNDTRQLRHGTEHSVSDDSNPSDSKMDGQIQLERRTDGIIKPFPNRGDELDAITIRDGEFGWKRDETPVLSDINVTITTSQLTVVVGQVGCGKTTLLKAILGETPISEGQVLISSREMSFCDQTPWLTNQTLQENITGYSKYDATWYSSVLRACALEDDIARFPEGDRCMVGSKGITLSGGQKQRVAIARAVYSRRRIAVFDDVLSGLDSETQKHVFEDVFGPQGLLRSQGSTIILATHAVHLFPYADNIVAIGTDGKIAAQGTFDELNDDGGILRRFGLERHDHDASSTPVAEEGIEPSALTKAKEELAKAIDDGTRRLGDRSVYKYYFESIGSLNTVIFFSIIVTWVVLLKFPEIWLKWWGDSNERASGQENGKYLGVYTVFQVMGLVALSFGIRHLFMVLVVTSGKKLHATLLTTVLRAPMPFFAATDTGTLINRFSQDIQLIDAELPIAFLNVTANGFICMAQAIMILPASYWLIITYPFIIGALYLIQKYYLRTSRQLRFLDLEAKSPIYSQFLETLNGLATIRAYGWQADLVRLNDQRLDYSQKPLYLLYIVQRWLNLVLDLIAAALAIILVAVSVSLRGSLSAGFAGVALYNVMNLANAMKAAVTVWTTLETSIGAVARIKNFEDTTPSETLPHESDTPPETWPDRGDLVIKDVTASYREGTQNVLNKVSLSFKPGEKVGICGRSGSGKSTLVLAIFRMIELGEGSITIDGIDISTLPREAVREHLNAIPQDPFFLSGTVRQNCDPRETASDDEIRKALTDVQLWELIESKGGLDSALSPDFFSHGQRQLFCLARAVLHPSKIVVMDEATSSLDVDTDKIMQGIIRTSFKDATVIAVAHRLDTILDFDSVVVIDKGAVVEHDSPQSLLARPSAFKSLHDTYDTCTGDVEKSLVTETSIHHV